MPGLAIQMGEELKGGEKMRLAVEDNTVKLKPSQGQESELRLRLSDKGSSFAL